VNVRVNEARDDPFSAHVYDPGPFGNDDLTERPHRPDTLPGDEHDGYPARGVAGTIDNRRANQGGHAGLGTGRRIRRDLHEPQDRLCQGAHGRPQAGPGFYRITAQVPTSGVLRSARAAHCS
jgi:hypothetical protein